MKVEVFVTLRPNLNDAQGEVVCKALHNLGYDEVRQVRIGKYLELEIAGDDQAQIEQRVRAMAEQLLSNPIIENFAVRVANPHNAWEVREAQSVYTAKPRVEDWSGFRLGVDDYERLDVNQQLDLYEEFLQHHEHWVQQELRARNATWLLVAGGAVMDWGDSRKPSPNSEQLRDLMRQQGRTCWLFENFLIEETAWSPVGDDDFYPAVNLEIASLDRAVRCSVCGDLDTGSNALLLDARALYEARVLTGRCDHVLVGKHLGRTFGFLKCPLRVGVTDVQGTRSSVEMECCAVLNWNTGPFVAVNPARQALAGRNLLLRLSTRLELDAKTHATRVMDAG